MTSIDIVVPSHNHIKFIDECISSILTQSYDNFNIIIIDDGSTDGSSEHLTEKYSSKKGIKVITQKNIGLCKTLNRAIFEFCTSKYVIIIGSDDQFLPNRLRSQAKLMDEGNYKLSYANCRTIDGNGVVVGTGVKGKFSGNLFEKLFIGEYNIPACTCIYSLDVLKEMGGFSEDALVEDSDMYLKVSNKYPIGYLDEYVSLYRRHGNNMSNTMTHAIYLDAIKRTNKYQSHPLYKKARKNVVLPAVLNLSKRNNRIEALKLIIKEKPDLLNRRSFISFYYLLGLNFFYDPYKNY
jgi:glycosyltransferase involved in cell wall biosynthesis